MEMHKLVLLLPVLIILCFTYCGKDSPSKSLSPSILWEKEQAVVSTIEGTKNLWSGFDIKNDFFVSNKAISKFILWRGEEKKKNITLQYLLKGRPVKVFINSREAFKLKPRYNLGTFTTRISLLKGFNFIEFRKVGKSIFKIKTLKIANQAVEEAYHLAPGESFSRFHPAGAGRIVLRGKGKVRIRLVEFIDGRKKSREKELEPGFLSGSVEYPFRFESPGFIKVSAVTGEIKDVIDDYDSTIRFVDDEVGKLLDKLKEEKLYESSFIIFTADHGEALYEHGYWGHGQNVYHETSRVPLIVKFPARMRLKGRVERVTQLVDIFPTFAALFGEKRYFDGQSLLESLRVKKEDDTFGFSTSFGLPPSIGIRWRSWYYIIHLFNNGEELFNLKKDPLKNAAGPEENKDLLTFFRAKFLDWYIEFDNIERTSQAVDLKKLPKGEYENLKSLGYID